VPALRCTVRACEGALAFDGAQLRCPNGHTFDRAREGYWNLLQPQDRRSLHAGDRDEAVAARRRWLSRGFASGLLEALRSAIGLCPNPAGGTVIDIGCGEGTFTSALFSGRESDVVGIDLSVRAIGLAARLAPGLTWIVANADRGIPVASGSVSLALSIFARRPVTELARVLRAQGHLVVVVPGADDLIELRLAAQGERGHRDRVPLVLNELAPAFALAARSDWRDRARHDREALEDALAMSYRGARARERERLAGLTELDVTMSASILTLVPGDGLR
jgi:23S rRNA (guanine745-N1)-methyltransferase